MYLRPLDLTASYSLSASSSEPKTAGTALATCLPCLSTSMQCRAWLGASVATKTASRLIVLDQLLERGIRLRAAAGFGQRGAAVGEQVADRGHLDIGVILKAERRAELADAVADDAHANPPIGGRLPGFLRAGGRLHSFRTEDLRIGWLGLCCAEQPLGRGGSQ